ncbi:hypothetical protein DSL72_002054 [Monilinia vaccinii-corymbosi]|uniref:Uncharacterized protein n=1 Tax=Monilinia vaccinii-corymbosi TaxID=61207 RepID=A0A8A3PBJ1_9HELO|nr:hypothetical protein DSL72_002054 [Monilinia vaccinii-corymbosi]
MAMSLSSIRVDAPICLLGLPEQRIIGLAQGVQCIRSADNSIMEPTEDFPAKT